MGRRLLGHNEVYYVGDHVALPELLQYSDLLMSAPKLLTCGFLVVATIDYLDILYGDGSPSYLALTMEDSELIASSVNG